MVFIGAVFLPAKQTTKINYSSCPHSHFFAKSQTSTSLDQLLLEVNQQFLTQHTKSSSAMLEPIQHVIVFFGGELSLWQKQNNDFEELTRAKTAGMVELSYLRAKQISHIVVLLITRFSEMIERKAPILLDAELFALFNKLLLIQKKLMTIDDKMKQQYQHIVNQTVLLLKHFHLNSGVQHLALQQYIEKYIQSMSEQLKILAEVAAKAQLQSLHEIMMSWKETYKLDLTLSRALIPVVHAPRDRLLEHQYFCSLFEQEINNHHANDNSVYCIEMLPKQMATLDIKRDLIDSFLPKCELDKRIGKYVFHDEAGMFKDILHQHAEEELNKMFTKK